MSELNERIRLHQENPISASTDMGNVSCTVPSFHGAFKVPGSEGIAMHSSGFAKAVATDGAHKAAMKCAQGMASLAIRVLVDRAVADGARRDFESDNSSQ